MDNDKKKLFDLFNSYLASGQALLQRLKAPTIHDSTLPENIAKWILKATDELFSIMPENCPDYSKLYEIKTQYINNMSILLPSARADIEKVLQNIIIAGDCFVAAMNSDHKDIPPENWATINYNRLKQACDYVHKELIKELKDREDGQTSRTAMLNIYGKIYLWIQSMIKLDGPENCLALAASVRAILELYIDLKLIDQEKIKNGIKKYFSFPNIEKYRSAKIIIEMQKEFNLITTNETKPINKYLSKSENSDDNIKKLKAQLWGKTKKGKVVKPNHWTNEEIKRRVKLLEKQDDKKIFLDSYYWCNWCVHSMYLDMINNIRNVHLFNWHLYKLAYDMFREATIIINDKIEILPKEDMKHSFENIENEAIKSFFREMVNAGRNIKNRSSKIQNKK